MTVSPDGRQPTDGRCSARRTDGSPCKNRPIKGGTVCWKHGGNARQVRAAAERRLAEQDARKAVATYGLSVDVDPGEALLEEVRWTAGHVLWLRDQVQQLSPADVSDVWVTLYREERKHLVDVCATAIRCGLEERRVRLAERQGEMVAAAFRALLESPELGLDDAQRRIGRRLASAQLRALAALPAGPGAPDCSRA